MVAELQWNNGDRMRKTLDMTRAALEWPILEVSVRQKIFFETESVLITHMNHLACFFSISSLFFNNWWSGWEVERKGGCTGVGEHVIPYTQELFFSSSDCIAGKTIKWWRENRLFHGKKIINENSNLWKEND